MNKEIEKVIKNPQEFLNKIPHHTVRIGDAVVELFKLGNFDNQSTWELVDLAPREYKQHLHDKTKSMLYIVY